MNGFRENIRDPLALRMLAQGDEFELETVLVGGRPRQVLKGLPRNLAQLYRAGMAYGDRTMVIDGDTRFTTAEGFARAAALARQLSQDYGIGQGDVVAVATINRAEWIIATLAVTSLGAIAALINIRGVAEEMLRAMDLVECKLTIIDADKDAVIAAQRPDPEWPRIVIDPPVAPLRAGRDVRFDDLAEPQSGVEFDPVDMPQEAGGVILFTSGTTGFPKGALLSQGAICQSAALACFMGRLQDIRYEEESGRTLPPDERCMATPAVILGPMFHLGGIMPTMRALYVGTTIVIPGKWNAEVAIDMIENIGMTRLSFVPAMVFDVFKSPRATLELLGRINNMANGAAPLDLDIVSQIKARMPNALISNSYGQTEGAAWTCSISGNVYLEHPASCGWPVPCVDVQLRRDDGTEADIGEPGELWMRGAGVMEGYWNNPEATAETIVDGWLATGDIATVDENGIYTIVDRKKSMVISGGENIYCAEVERVVASHPAVREAFAYGVPDARLGEIVAVECVVDPGSDVDAEAIKAHAKEHLAIYKVPRLVNFRHDALPRTASGKVDRGTLLRDLKGDAR
ncbi:MAG: AMP-binding protein [Novosphingobium sp.]|nr:AMP-binding protein [Novosphingobium sp.]